jgi:hypothetical protein
MGRALDCAARSTDPLAQLSRVERRKRYGGIPVWLIGAVAAYDAPDAVTRIGITSNDSGKPPQERGTTSTRLLL